MWVLVQDGKITRTFNSPKGFVLNDTQYPRDIFNKWSQAEKEAIGIYEVIVDKTNYKDSEYYNNSNSTITFENNQATESWGTATARRLTDENVVDENNQPILDEDGNQLINYGLKTIKKRIVKNEAASLLAPTDWYVIKATEVADYTIPADITTYRAAVRTRSNEMETAIDGAADVDALKVLYEYTEHADGSSTRPLGEWPEEVI
tara:strand:+ start:687 stop:1301 length:615 start_codon:yes stop_codon:yes gene_type:complete